MPKGSPFGIFQQIFHFYEVLICNCGKEVDFGCQQMIRSARSLREASWDSYFRAFVTHFFYLDFMLS